MLWWRRHGGALPFTRRRQDYGGRVAHNAGGVKKAPPDNVGGVVKRKSAWVAGGLDIEAVEVCCFKLSFEALADSQGEKAEDDGAREALKYFKAGCGESYGR